MSENWDDIEISDTNNESEPAGDIELLKQSDDLMDLELRTESENSPETIKKRKKLFYLVKNKFLAMAAAGFLTLGGGWEDSFADQLRLKISADKSAEFVLEEGITEEKFKAFKEKLEKEEPEFMEWVNNFAQKVAGEIDKLTETILAVDPVREKKEGILAGNLLRGFRSTEEQIKKSISQETKLLKELREKPEELKEYQEFLKENLKTIILDSVILTDSKQIRDGMREFIESPVLVFKSHTPRYSASTSSEPPTEPDKFKSAIQFNPRSFKGYESEIDLRSYVDTFIHELNHAIDRGISLKKGHSTYKTNLGEILVEGNTQKIAFETIRHLSLQYPEKNLKPYVGWSEYDGRLIIASTFEAILKNYKTDDNIFSKWYSGMVDDQDLIGALDSTLRDLGLNNKEIIDYLDKLQKHFITNRRDVVRNFIAVLFAELKLANVGVPDELMENILKNNSHLDEIQLEDMRSITTRGLNEGIDARVRVLKKTRTK